MDSPMRIKFWGTRGLISSPRAETAIFGGNTSCLQVLYKDQLIIIDTGFGVSNLGENLMDKILKEGSELKVHILFTHFHWDHIQGLPFFHPIYFPTTKMDLYSPVNKNDTFENLDILFDGSYSPFGGLKSMPSKIDIHQMKGKTKIGDLVIEHQELDHGSNPSELNEHHTFAFKFTAPDGSNFVLATDHEARDSATNDRLIEFAKNTDLLIHDAQFNEEEYVERMGWGHSTYGQALDNSLKINPQHTILTHHDPKRDDAVLQDIYRDFKSDKKYKDINFKFAREEIVYDVVLNASKKDAKAS